MRLYILTLAAIVLFACSSGPNTLKYSYLPKTAYKYYKPLNPVDLRGKHFRLSIIDSRTSNKISCSEIPLPKNLELEGGKGLDYFKSYLRGMIEINNGIVDHEDGQEIKIDLLGMSSETYGFAVVRIFGLVEFVATVDGKVKSYCSEMDDADEDSPVGNFALTAKSVSRDLVSGSVRRAFEEFMQDLSTMN